MKEAISQETMSDSSHSCISEENGCSPSNSSLKSAAMLGIALSVGTSGVLISQAEASAAVSAPTTSATTEAFSSDAEVSAQDAASVQVVAYHTVETGESLWQIAQRHRVGLRELKDANALPPETAIRVGQVLKVPASNQAPATETSALIASITADETEASIAETTTDVSSTDSAEAPVLMAQSEAQLQAQPQVQSAPSLAQLQASSSATTTVSESIDERNTASIEIADASDVVSDLGGTVSVEQQPDVTTLAVAPSLEQYRVRAGDTINTIAASLGTTSDAIVRANSLANPNVILAGDVLSVPATRQANLAETSVEPIKVASSVPGSERLSYLRSTATRPDDAAILEEIREAAPEEAASVGGTPATASDLLSSTPARAESIDPYVANLLEEVRDIRAQSVQVSEVEVTQSALVESDAIESVELDTSATEELVESGRRSSLLARNETATSTPSLSERVARSRAAAEDSDVDSELLAAAPLSPDAYIPAQRSSEPQVVSPDMPILPSADEYLPEAPNYFDGYVWPARGTVTSGYGWRWGRMHRGVDVAGPVGTPIVAAAPGVVEQAGWNSGGYGNLVEIRHPDGSMTRYAHNNSLSVSKGQSVKQGQQIAEMGSTGYSTGPHLHFEVHQGGGAVNPVAYLPSR